MGGETVALHLVAGIFLIRLHQILFTTHTNKNLTNDHTIYQKYIENHEILTSDELGLSEGRKKAATTSPPTTTASAEEGGAIGGRRRRETKLEAFRGPHLKAGK